MGGAMIDIITTNTALDLNISLSDIMCRFFRFENNDNVKFHYDSLAMKKQIGTALKVSSLLRHPRLCKQLRKVNHGKYLVNLNLHQIDTLKSSGIDAVIESLQQLKGLLAHEQKEKASLDSVIYNLICLYGNEQEALISQSVKPYFYNRQFNRDIPYTGAQACISGIRYNFSNNGFYKKHKSHIYSSTANDLLENFYKKSKSCTDEPLKSHLNEFIGGFLKTPVFAFRMRSDWSKRGQKYYIDLKTNKAYTRITEARKTARQYNEDAQLIILEN